MAGIIQFPSEPFYRRNNLDELLAKQIGTIALLHERLHRNIAQIFKVASGHMNEVFWHGFVSANDDLDFSFANSARRMSIALSALVNDVWNTDHWSLN